MYLKINFGLFHSCMRLQLTFIFFVIFGTENMSPALLVLEIITTFWRLGRHDSGWSNSSLFLAAGSVAVLSEEDLQKYQYQKIFQWLMTCTWQIDQQIVFWIWRLLDLVDFWIPLPNLQLPEFQTHDSNLRLNYPDPECFCPQYLWRAFPEPLTQSSTHCWQA